MTRRTAIAHRLAALSLAVSLASIAATPTEAHAQGAPGVEEGRTRFLRGIEMYKEGNFHAALAEFRAAYAAAPSYRIHYNLGQTLYQLQDYAGAVGSFEQYLSEGGDKVDHDRKKEVENDLAKLRPRVARLTIVVNVPNAELLIDDEPRGKVEKKPALVSAGRRRVAVTASGYQTETRVLDVAGTQQLSLEFELKPIGGGSSARGDDRPSGGSDSTVLRPKSRTWFYVGLTSTVVLAGGAGVMAIVTSGNKSEYEKALEVPNNKSEIDAKKSSTKTTALVGDILGGTAIVAGGLTILAYVLTSGTEPVPKTGRSGVVVRPLVGPTSMGLSGTF